jgi:5-methylthioadenosine/S-adenosylhomocysteine deaminase
VPSDLFLQMRGLIISDHQLETERVRREGGRPNLIPVCDVLEFATIEGARATGLDGKTGTLSVGKRADIIVVDLDDITLIPTTDPIATFVLRVRPANRRTSATCWWTARCGNVPASSLVSMRRACDGL